MRLGLPLSVLVRGPGRGMKGEGEGVSIGAVVEHGSSARGSVVGWLGGWVSRLHGPNLNPLVHPPAPAKAKGDGGGFVHDVAHLPDTDEYGDDAEEPEAQQHHRIHHLAEVMHVLGLEAQQDLGAGKVQNSRACMNSRHGYAWSGVQGHA